MKGTMLVVEDESTSREILSLMFKDQYDIIEAYNGLEALEIVEEIRNKIDIIILDLVMEPVNGLEVLKKRQEKEFFKQIPVIVITAKTSVDAQIEALKLGANDFISKPFIPDIVYPRIANVMTSRERMLAILMKTESLQAKSEIDAMTGLYSKTVVEEKINEVLMSNNGTKLSSLIFIDIDNFKGVNDNSGHLIGDQVIRTVANLISSYFRKSDIVGRIGGDEFVVLMEDVPSMDIVREKVSQLVLTMQHEPNITLPVNVTLSIGYASNNYKQISYKELFDKADNALYKAKSKGKSCAVEYGRLDNNYEYDMPVAVLMSNNRTNRSVVLSLTPSKLHIVEVKNEEELKGIELQYNNRLVFCIIDISNGNLEYRKILQNHDFSMFKSVISICHEGDMEQFRFSDQCHVKDFISSPVDEKSYKRRFMDWL